MVTVKAIAAVTPYDAIVWRNAPEADVSAEHQARPRSGDEATPTSIRTLTVQTFIEP